MVNAEPTSPPPDKGFRVRVRLCAPPAGPSQEAGASPGLPTGGLESWELATQATEELRSQVVEGEPAWWSQQQEAAPGQG